jgi:hypothetical protein
LLHARCLEMCCCVLVQPFHLPMPTGLSVEKTHGKKGDTTLHVHVYTRAAAGAAGDPIMAISFPDSDIYFASLRGPHFGCRPGPQATQPYSCCFFVRSPAGQASGSFTSFGPAVSSQGPSCITDQSTFTSKSVREIRRIFKLLDCRV